jgi:coenzyme F420-reducing hydrogenase delta subunit
MTQNAQNTTQNAERKTQDAFEPKIVAFLCNWCSYAGADLAGTSRKQYPPNIRIIKVPCTGRLDPLVLVKSFEIGADGILVSGCHPNDCHYRSGNFYARRRWIVFKDFLEYVGLEKGRVQFSWVSAAEGNKFVEVVTKITNDIKALGPFKGFNQ